MLNVRLLVAYDGGGFLGWQKTRMGPSIEEELQSALEKILQEKIALQAASRTDAGVHAQGQVVNFFTKKELVCFERLKISLNGLLKKGIAVLHAEEAPESFHPTLDAQSKEYHYSVCYGQTQSPFHRHYSWHYPHCLDLASMRQAAAALIGNHDFSTFCKIGKNSTCKDYIRKLEAISIADLSEQRLRIIMRGNRFLYRMARIIAGTLIYAGCGKIDLSAIKAILASKDRTLAGVTAPAHGLCLYSVNY